MRWLGIFVAGLLSYFSIFGNLGDLIAQEKSSGIARELPIAENVEAGDIICSTDSSFKKCSLEYQTTIYGVVVDTSVLEITGANLPGARKVVADGIATVKVKSVNGNIKKGNFITSSSTAGVGQLATRGGYVLGTALEDYENSDQNAIGRIQILINIHPATGMSKGTSNLLRYIREGLTIPIFEPLESLRYLLASIMVIISFALGLVYFGKSGRSGIEAIGRNPLARKTIQMTIFFNILLTIVIILSGLGIAYLILIL